MIKEITDELIITSKKKEIARICGIRTTDLKAIVANNPIKSVVPTSKVN